MDGGRKSRRRKEVDYSALLSITDDDDFFPQDSPPYKKLAVSSGRTAKSDQEHTVRGSRKSSKAKKPESVGCKPGSILTSGVPVVVSNHPGPHVLSTPQPPSNIQTSTSSISAKTLPVARYSSVPSTPVNARSVALCITPTSGLRLGLSRRGALKPLHTNIRLAQ
ncbi:hypothetical protein AAHC03_01623 [Spirometra sp. Aus1]